MNPRSGHLLSGAGKARCRSCLSEGSCHNGDHLGRFIAILFTFLPVTSLCLPPFFVSLTLAVHRNVSFVLSLNYIKPMRRKLSELSFFESIKLRTLFEVPPQKKQNNDDDDDSERSLCNLHIFLPLAGIACLNKEVWRNEQRERETKSALKGFLSIFRFCLICNQLGQCWYPFTTDFTEISLAVNITALARFPTRANSSVCPILNKSSILSLPEQPWICVSNWF